MSLNQDQVVDYIKNLKLGEVKSLIETLETELGVKASAPVGVMPLPGVLPDTPPTEVQTAFDVCLTGFDETKKIGVIKTVRELTGLGLKEAKELVETRSAKVKEGLGKAEAEAASAKLVEAGATVEVK